MMTFLVVKSGINRMTQLFQWVRSNQEGREIAGGWMDNLLYIKAHNEASIPTMNISTSEAVVIVVQYCFL
jgi:hypothetical protein